MLILTRHLGESIKIGDEVTVTILGVKKNQVRVGIDAPKHVAVHREEIYKRIQAEKLTDISEARREDFPSIERQGRQIQVIQGNALRRRQH